MSSQGLTQALVLIIRCVSQALDLSTGAATATIAATIVVIKATQESNGVLVVTAGTPLPPVTAAAEEVGVHSWRCCWYGGRGTIAVKLPMCVINRRTV